MELKDIIGSLIIIVVVGLFAYFGEILNAEKNKAYESEQEEDKRTDKR